MADVTITLDDQDLARVRALAQAEGLSVEEWQQDLPPVLPIRLSPRPPYTITSCS